MYLLRNCNSRDAFIYYRDALVAMLTDAAAAMEDFNKKNRAAAVGELFNGTRGDMCMCHVCAGTQNYSQRNVKWLPQHLCHFPTDMPLNLVYRHTSWYKMLTDNFLLKIA